MARRFPVSLLSRMDAYLERKNERLRRDSTPGVGFGTTFLLLCLYHLLVQREGLSLNVAITFTAAFLTYLWAAWDYLVYKRSLSGSAAGSSTNTYQKELPPPASPGASLPPPSVTEQTTRHLHTVENRPEKTS